MLAASPVRPHGLPRGLFPLAVVAIYATAIGIVRTQPLETGHGVLGYAVMVDLVLVVPGLWFLLQVRGRSMRPGTLLPVLVLSVLGAALVLPPPYRGGLRWLAVPIEITVLGLLVLATSKALRNRSNPRSADPGLLPEAIAAVARSVFGIDRLADVIAYEAGLLVFAFAGWRMRPSLDGHTFTLHDRSGWNTVALGLGLVLVVEVFPVHVALQHITPWLAWIVSALSAYSLLWLIGDYQALRLRPCRLQDGALLVRVGLRWKATIPKGSIAGIHRVRGAAVRGRDYWHATVVGDPTVLIELLEPIHAIGPYGWTRAIRRIGLAPDDERSFLAAIEQAMTRDAP